MTYDLNGNLATLTDPSGTTTYTWNARNQLVSLSGPGLTASFQYDALGRRQQKTVNGTTTDFLYHGVSLVQELSGGVPIVNLLTGGGIDEVLSRTDAAGTQTFLADGLGSTLALTDSLGTVQAEYTYEPFGQTTASGAASTNAFQYTGRENDETGLSYYRARYYHPTLQRFISEDPIGFAGGDVNLYGYVLNDPVNFIDPSGLFLRFGRGLIPGIGGGPGEAFGGVAGAVAGAMAGTATGIPGAGFAGGVVGSQIGGALGAMFDPLCAGQLNCEEFPPQPVGCHPSPVPGPPVLPAH
jgi:RHS repeat-associated protein